MSGPDTTPVPTAQTEADLNVVPQTPALDKGAKRTEIVTPPQAREPMTMTMTLNLTCGFSISTITNHQSKGNYTQLNCLHSSTSLR